MPEGPLSGFKVIDLTTARSGPTAVRVLSDFGADVIQVVRPSAATLTTRLTRSDDENLHRNKRSMVLDLQKPEGKDVLLRLVKSADVVVENYRPDVKHRLGIDYEALSQVNPRLVYGSISGFGQEGPYQRRPGLDQIIQGMGGLMMVTGPEGTGPWRAGTAISDLSAGVLLATGIIAALLERERSGKGQWVHTSLLEAMISMMDFQAARWLVEKEIPEQVGNDHPTVFPSGVFETADGHVSIAATSDRMFGDFARALDMPELAENEMYNSRATRTRNKEQLRALCQERIKLKTTAEWIEKLNEVGVPCGPIYRMDQVFADPQVQHLKMYGAVESPTAGTINILRSPINFSRTPASLRTAAPAPGVNTEELLRENGFSDEQIAKLAELGITKG